jgi:hypothetical protein
MSTTDNGDNMSTLLDTIHTKPLDEARVLATQYIESSMDSKKPNIMRLIYDVKTAKSSKEISGILWRARLAKEGLRTINSSWKKHYDQV